MKTDDAGVGWDGMDRRTRVGFVWKFHIYWKPRWRGEHDLTSRLRVDPRIGGPDAGFAMDNHGVRDSQG